MEHSDQGRLAITLNINSLRDRFYQPSTQRARQAAPGRVLGWAWLVPPADRVDGGQPSSCAFLQSRLRCTTAKQAEAIVTEGKADMGARLP
jgi:hypothetical protein